MTLKQAQNKAKVSTDRSDEDYKGPGSTLSLLIAQFDPSWPDINNLAVKYRLIGLSTRQGHTAPVNVGA